MKALKTFTRHLLSIEIEVYTTILFALIICFQLYGAPQLGLADNADFGRVFSRMGLEHLNGSNREKYFTFFNPEYIISGEAKFPVNITQVFVFISLILNKIIYSREYYSIYFLSAIYSILYIAGFYLFFRNLFNRVGVTVYTKVATLIMGIIILSDPVFLAYFNSLYQEPAFIVFFLLAVALFLSDKKKYDIILPVLILLSVSKMQNLIYFIFPFLIIIYKYKDLNKIGLAGSLFLASFFTFFLLQAQEVNKPPNLYEAVFLGLMHEADHKEQKKILNDLNLKAEGYLKHVKKIYWRRGNEMGNRNSEVFREFYREVSLSKIGITYLRNPKVLIKTIYAGMEQLFLEPAQPVNLGNFKKEDSPNGELKSKIGIWGTILGYVFLPIYVISILSIIPLFKKLISDLKVVRNLIIILLIGVAIVFHSNLIAGGINDFVKHNLSVYFMISILSILTFIIILTPGYLFRWCKLSIKLM